MSDQRDEKIQELSVEVTRLTQQVQRLEQSNAALTRQRHLFADRCLEAEEQVDELRTKLNALTRRSNGNGSHADGVAE